VCFNLSLFLLGGPHLLLFAGGNEPEEIIALVFTREFFFTNPILRFSMVSFRARKDVREADEAIHADLELV
jgi:hypothetical protein